MSDLDFSHIPKDRLEAVLDRPAISPPAGVVSNFETPENQNAVSLVALILCLVASFTFLLIRIYVRFFKLRQRHIVDYILVVAYPFYITIVVGSLRRIASASGLFVHQWNVRGRDMESYLYTIFVGICCWVATMLLIKASILLEWIRIFAPTHTRSFFSWGCRIMLALNISFYCAVLIAFNLSCSPYARLWDKTLAGRCLDIKVINLVATVVNCLLDIAILLLPQRVICELHMTKKKKIGISTVFAVGILACAAAMALLNSVVQWMGSDDMTYHYSGVALWAIAESTCGILVLCVPVAPTAFRDYEPPKWLSVLESWATSSSIDRLKGRQRSEEVLWPHSTFGVTQAREYENIEEPGTIHLQNIESGRPTDQQYGIIRTTDITVVETYDSTITNNHGSLQYPWHSMVHNGQP